MDGPEDEQSCYAILGVDPAATSSEIRQAWAILSVVRGQSAAGNSLCSHCFFWIQVYISTYLTPKHLKSSQSFHYTFPPSLPTVPTQHPQPEMDSCQAYRKLALAKHPDRGGDPAEFARVTKAYEVRSETNGWDERMNLENISKKTRKP